MKSFFTPWPKEINALPKEKKQEAIKTIVSKSQKLRLTFMLSLSLTMILVCVVIYLALFVYGTNLERSPLQITYLLLGCLVISSLWIIPVKIVIKSEYIRLKSEIY